MLLVVSAVATAACGDPMGPLPRGGVPQEFEFAFGGFGMGTRVWEVRGDTLLYRNIPWGYPVEPMDSTRVVLIPDDWEVFWAHADRAGVRHWRRQYVAENVVDGVGWSLRLGTRDIRIRSEGSNAFPDSRGRKHTIDVPREFQDFMNLLEGFVQTP